MNDIPRNAPMPDVLIIGGGVLGLAASCELLSHGYTVTLVDRGSVERGSRDCATRAAAGMLSPYAELTELDSIPNWVDLMALALRSYPDFVRNVINTSGLHVECRFPGSLVTNASGGKGFDWERSAEQMRDLGADVEVLDADQIYDREPGLEAESGLFFSDEGYVDPRALHDALRLSFVALGGTWIESEVFDLIMDGDQVVGVRSGRGDLQAGSVLNTSGHACGRFLLPEDKFSLRPTPVAGEVIRLRPQKKDEGVQCVVQVPGRAYIVPRDDGTVLIGATVYEGSDEARVRASGVASLIERAALYLPASGEWEWVETWCGVRPRAGSGEPKAWADSRPGLFHGMGLYRNGILLAPVVGAQLARLVAEYLGQASRRSVGGPGIDR